MKKAPTISIVTPSYNQGRFIAETIESVLSQEGDFYIEYLVMDGGSTDNSVEVIKNYDRLLKEGNWPVKCLGITYSWVSEKDKGQSDAINKGFRQAKGDYVAWLNSDDLYSRGAFSVITSHFANHPADDFVYGDGDIIDENGNLQREWTSRKYNYPRLKSYDFRRNLFNNFIMQQSVFWRKGVFEKIGYIDESLHYAMDYEYWIRAGAKGLKLSYLHVKLGKFRMIANTKSLSSPTVFWPETLEIFRRYNGARSMAPFLAYFYLNEALYNNFDLDHVHKQEEKIFKIWDSLRKDELNALREMSEKGFLTACLLIAVEALKKGEKEKAEAAFKKAISLKPSLLLHPKAFVYGIKRICRRDF